MKARAFLAGGALLALPLAAADGTAYAQASAVILPAATTGRSEELLGEFTPEELAEALASAEAEASSYVLLPLPPARFQISGRRSIAFALALPGPGGVPVQGRGGTGSVQDFRVALSAGGPGQHPGMLTLSPTGGRTLLLGANLRVPGTSLRGLFRGQVPFTISYN